MTPPSESVAPHAMMTPSITERTRLPLSLIITIGLGVVSLTSSAVYTKANVDSIKEQQAEIRAELKGGSTLSTTVQQHNSRIDRLELWREEDRRERMEELKTITGKIDAYQLAIMGQLTAMQERMARQEERGTTQRGMTTSERRMR